ncbi:MAG: Flp pilus assembly complex ATPase component TadA [Alphaproteobacteria bacterium]|nr:Flp pilus assembly complex ATPase component TadA [Alphaproteobacteria bacterium]
MPPTPPAAAAKPTGAPKKSSEILAELFSAGNECLTAPSGKFPAKEDTRSMLALFSNGRFLVSSEHKFDGRVISFETLARKRGYQVARPPEYVPPNLIKAIYDRAAKDAPDPTEEEQGGSAANLDQLQMQKDYLDVLQKAAGVKVSDIHVVVGTKKTEVIFRQNGMMQVIMERDKDWGEAFVRAAFASSDISDANYASNEYQAAQKLGETALRGSGGKLRLPRNVLGVRLQFNPIAFGTRYLVMRMLYADDDPDNAGDLMALGYTQRESDMFYRLRAVPIGIIIVAGPTGSGKSTTLQRNMISMLQERNFELNLITVEDPPEYPIPGARQMPVTNAENEKAKEEAFTKALAASLRSDPDMLMIGEIRTLSAAQLAFKGALSGHGVWSTLHANSSPAVIMRLRDMGVEPFKLIDPEIMKGMVSQRLFGRICPNCALHAKDHLDNPVVKRLRKAYGDFGLETACLKGPGCADCQGRGVKGRCVVGEILLPDATFLDLLVKGETKKAIDYWTGDLGGRTMKDCAVERMLKGLVSCEEVERWCGLLDERPVY